MEIVSLKNINKAFKTHIVFQDYSLSVDVGDFVAITGRSGSGKSTLLNIVGLLDTPDSGEITICGTKNPSIHSKAGISLLRNKISYAFQNYGLIEDQTVDYNIKIAMKFSSEITRKNVQQTIKSVLGKVSLEGFEKKESVSAQWR